MSDLFRKMRVIEAEIAQERGGILFCGLLKAAELPDQWDLMLVAPWALDYTLDDLRYVAAKLRAQLDMEETLSLSRIVLLDPDGARSFADAGVLAIRPGGVQAVRLPINERLITQIYVITADPDALRQAGLHSEG